MDRVVQSESIQCNRVGSNDLNLADMSRNSISHWFQSGILSYMGRCLTIEYAKFGRSKGHLFFPPMDRVVHSEFIQYNRVGSNDLNLADMSRNSISHWFQLGILSYMGRCLTIEYAKFGRSEGHPFFPPMDRLVQSESIQYNRVGSKDLNLADMSRNSISHWFQLGILSYIRRCLTIEYAKFGRSEGHQFFSTNG